MGAIKAIETEYKGHLMRSRLEARWAVFFDALRITWRYEEQGFELPSGQMYLPDFHLPEHELWVEVKGAEEDLREDAGKLAEAAFTMPGGGLLILGPVPDVRLGLPQHFVITRHDHCCGKAVLCPHILWAEALHHPAMAREGALPCTDLMDHRTDTLPALKGYGGGRATYTDPGPVPFPGYPAGDAAYRAARSARFEHGQSGATL